MGRIEWKIAVSQEVALAARKSTYGDVAFAPSDEQLAELTDDEVAFTTEYQVIRSGIPIAALPVDWVSVRAAIREGGAKLAAKREEKRAKFDASVAEFLATKAERNENWKKGLGRSNDRAKYACKALLPDMLDSDEKYPQIEIHKQKLRADAERITAEMQADAAAEFLSRSFDDMLDHTRSEGWVVKDECRLYLDLTEATTMLYCAASAEADRRNAADAKAQEDDEIALVASLNDYAKTRGWYTRALEDGYEVHEQVFDDLVNECARGLPSIVTSYREDSPEWETAKIEDREAPSEFAFQIRDQVVEAVERFDVPALVRKDVSRIFRFRPKDTREWTTVVLVWFSVDSEKVSSRVVVVRAEPQPNAICG